MKRTLADAARQIGGTLIGEDREYGTVSTDTRTLGPGALFVGLRGPNFDGTQFVAAAQERGAVAAMVERASASALAQIVVPDALQALQSLAASWRSHYAGPVVAVAGSNGKTTTKGMTAAILARSGRCLSTEGNLNNHIGVPVTLMRLEATFRTAVIELGANRVGDVAELMQWVRPTVGLITNAGAEHLEGFGDLQGVAQGEGEAVAGLDAAATAVINADDAFADYWRKVSGTRQVVSFGVQKPADVSARAIVQGVEGGAFATRFTLVTPQGERPVTLRVGGAHNIGNALAAAAAAGAAGAVLEDIVQGLGDFRPVAGRLVLKAGPRGSRIIDDSYNANPSSVHAGIDVLQSLSGETWAVLGEMAELGAFSESSHSEVGAYARAAGVRRLFGLGVPMKRAVEAFGSGAEWFADAESLSRRLQEELAPGVTVLIKGSRINRLERVVQALSGGGSVSGHMMRVG
jgi:UDP-N-acetylmuramoyl-tripeptide--D-alanyl-D-alanine ligase